MNPKRLVSRGSLGRRRAFSLAESLISILIVGTLLVAALNTLGASKASQRNLGLRGQAELLGRQLLAEIMSGTYEDPDETPVFGVETGEIAAGRTAYDDVDDYHGWSSSPAQRKDGTKVADEDWGRNVTVEYVLPTDFTTTSVSDQGVKHITVTVSYKNVDVLSVIGIRTRTAAQ